MAAAWDLSGNPSSVHAEGRQARGLVEEARATIAGAVGALPRNVVFTSGGTEANALALTPGLRRGSGISGQEIAGLGHRARLGAGGRPVSSRSDRHRWRYQRRPLGSGPPARDARGRPPALVSVMLANNETGAVQPVAEAAEIVHAAGGLLHVDAIQAFGKIPFDINAMNADLVTLSAHKIGGPKGVGALGSGRGAAGTGSRCCAAAVRNWGDGRGPRTWPALRDSAPRPRLRWRCSKGTPFG